MKYLNNEVRFLLRVGSVTALVVVAKIIVHAVSWEVISLNALFTGIIAANVFLMSRVREESSTRELLPGIRVASARTGTVITSAGLILAGTFGALVTSPLQLLFQVGLAVGLGVLIDTFVVRSLLVPALTAFIGERAWWPFHRRRIE